MWTEKLSNVVLDHRCKRYAVCGPYIHTYAQTKFSLGARSRSPKYLPEQSSSSPSQALLAPHVLITFPPTIWKSVLQVYIATEPTVLVGWLTVLLRGGSNTGHRLSEKDINISRYKMCIHTHTHIHTCNFTDSALVQKAHQQTVILTTDKVWWISLKSRVTAHSTRVDTIHLWLVDIAASSSLNSSTIAQTISTSEA